MSRSKSKRIGRISFAEQRKVIEMASHGRSAAEISKATGRPTDTVVKLAMELGIRLRPTPLEAR
jgi:hypothetical protein